MITSNKTKLALLLLVFVQTSVVFGQDYSFKDYKWDEKNLKIEVPEAFATENEVILSRHSKVELVLVNDQARQYNLVHERIFINSDDAIERNNKIYIPFNENEKVLVNRARVILKNGKVIQLDKKDIKEEVDEERGVKYNYFAVNGLEKGAVVEKIFILEEFAELNGKTIRMQEEYPIVDLSFELIYPLHLSFKTMVYNGLGEPVTDSEKLAKKAVLSISEKNVPALNDDEKYSNWMANVRMLRYKLDGNAYTGAKNLYNFKEFSTNLYDRMHPVLDKKQQKSVDDFCKTIIKSTDPQEQIWNIENKIKKTFTYNRYIDTQENLAAIIKSKQANQGDMLRLYLAVFKHFNIENNMVLTSNRYKLPFDKEFESYENLNEILFYFPAIKKFLTPTEIEYRIPLIPAGLAHNNGLFIKEKLFAGTTMGIGEVNFIPIPGTEITHDVMEITVDFTENIENPTISNKMTFGGYSALNFQPIKDFVSADEYKTILKSIAENYANQTEFKSLTTQNDGTDHIGKKPFQFDIAYEGKELIQKAGDNYLFSIGAIIGKQLEFYQENKRNLPVEIDYPHSYLRTIKIKLPKGVTVKNLDQLKMNYKTLINDKTEAVFISDYKSNGQEIIIENTEYYNIINYPLNKFDEYKAVINAAADFNKVVIILNK